MIGSKPTCFFSFPPRRSHMYIGWQVGVPSTRLSANAALSTLTVRSARASYKVRAEFRLSRTLAWSPRGAELYWFDHGPKLTLRTGGYDPEPLLGVCREPIVKW